MKAKLTGIVAGVLLSAGALRADDWPGFRGPSGNGISSEPKAPTTWGPDKNIKWKVALPQKGNGSPIVASGRVFIAGSEDKDGKVRALYCFDRKDGKQLWVKTVNFGKVLETHQTNTHSPSTPASDGKSVVVWHGSAGLHCYDFEGKELWSRDLGEFEHLWGEGTSPVIHDGMVFLNSGPSKKKVFLAAFKLASGETVWEKDEPFKGDGERNENDKFMGSWSTPLVYKDQLICAMPTRVVAYAPADGKLLWSCEGLRFSNGDLAYSSPVVVGDTCIVFGGFNGVGLGVKLGGSGDVTASHRLWRLDKKVAQSIGSGVVVGDHVYLPFENAIDCIDPKTGAQVWRQRASAGLWSSLTLIGDKAYVIDQKGKTTVFKPSPEKFELVATNDLGEGSNSTPAVSNGEIFIRTFKNLYCIAE
jgi:outer membrane protein assembly factor BamB